MERLNRIFVLAAVVLVAALMLASPSAAQTDDSGTLSPCPEDFDSVQASDAVVRVVKVAGLIDPVVKGHLMDQLGDTPDNVIGLVLWMNSSGSVLDDADFNELADAMASFEPTLAVWVGQPGAAAQGGAAELAGLADVLGLSPGSKLGDTGPIRSKAAETHSIYGEARDRLRTESIDVNEAIRLGISVGPSQDTATIGTFLTYVPGYETLVCTVQTAASTADGDGEDGEVVGGGAGSSIRTIPITTAQFSNLPLIAGFFHTAASPEVAYLFFTIGLALLVFELFTAGVGIAGGLGVVFTALGSYGLAVLPTRWWGVALIVLAFLALAVDIQTNVPRLYTIIGLSLFTIGTFTMYDGVSMSWITIVAGLVGAMLYAYTGMPSMVRTRFSTPTIGRTWMIGEMGTAVTDVTPEGTIKMGEAKWRAIANRATPIKAGDPVRVIGIDRLLLEVEPEEGGAKDYRDRG